MAMSTRFHVKSGHWAGQGMFWSGYRHRGARPIVAALCAAREIGMVTIGFTGHGNGQMSEHCDLVFRAPSASTPLIQQIRITIGHIVCQIVGQAMFGARGDEA